MADLLWTALRILHIGSALAFVGGATLWGAVLTPTLTQMGPSLPKGFMSTVGGKVVRFLPTMALVALLTGVPLFVLMMPSTSPEWKYLMAAALVLLVAILGVAHGVLVPTFRKLGQAMAALQGPPGPEVLALQAKMKRVSELNLAMAWTTVVLMVVATALRTT